MTTKPLTQRIQLEGGDKIRAELERIGKTAADALSKLNVSQAKAGGEAANLSARLGEVSKGLDGVDASGGRATVTIGGLAAKFGLLVGSIAAAGAGLVALAKSAADSIASTQQAASKLGITVREYERLSVVSRLAGAGAEAFGGSVGQITKTMAELERAGVKHANGFFQVTNTRLRQAGSISEATSLRIGDGVEQILANGQRIIRIATEENLPQLRAIQAEQGKLRDGASETEKALSRLIGPTTRNGEALKFEEILVKVADAIQKVGSSAERVKVLTDAGLIDFLPVLEQGGAKLAETFKRIDDIKFGTELTKQQRETLGEFRLNMALFEASAKAGRDKLKVAFVEAFAGPFGEVVKLITTNGGAINNALQGIIRGAGRLFQALIDVFSGKVSLANIVDTAPFAAVQRFILRTVEVVKAFGVAVKSVVDNVVRPAFGRLIAAAADAGDAGEFAAWPVILKTIADNLDVVLSGLALGAVLSGRIVPPLIRVAKWFAVIAAVVAGQLALAGTGTKKLEEADNQYEVTADKLIDANQLLPKDLARDARKGGGEWIAAIQEVATAVRAALQRVATDIGGTAFASSANSFLDGVLTSLARIFGGGKDVIDGQTKQVKSALDKYKSTIKDGASIKFPGADTPAAGDSKGAPGVPSKGVIDESSKALEQFREVFREVRDAIANAYTEVKKFFTESSGGGSKVLEIYRGLVKAFNAIFGTEFTAGGFAVVVLFTAWLGVLMPVLRVLAALSTIVASFVTILFTVLAPLGKIALALGVWAFQGGKAALAFLGAGKVIAQFSKIATVAIRGVMVAIGGLIGWPALLLAGAGLVYAYWDDIKAAAAAAWKAIEGFVKPLWDGFLQAGTDVWAGIRKVGSDTWDGLTTIGRDYWLAMRTVGSDTWAGIRRIGSDSWQGFYTAGEDAWAGMRRVGSDVWAGLSEVYRKYWSGVRTVGSEAWEGIKVAASAAASLIAKALGLSESDQSKIEKELVDPFRAAIDAVNQLMTVDLPGYVEDGLSAVVSALENMASAVETQVRRIEEAVSRAKDAAASMPSGGGEGAPFASGGYVRGPGSGTSDSIPAWLSNGEFVVRAAAVRQYGVSFLRAINGMSVSPRAFKMGTPAFAMGGLVGPVPLPAVAGGGSMPGKSFDLHIDGTTFGGLYAPEQTAARLMQYATQAGVRSAGRKPGWVR